MNKTLNVSQLLATPDLTYINGTVVGWLIGIRPPNGRGPSKAKLQDNTGVIEVSLWGGSVQHHEGKRVAMSGKGMQIKEYRGVKGLSVGDKVNIAQLGDSGPSGEQFPGDPAPTPPAPTKPSYAPQTAQKEAPPAHLPHGATVGGALARAVEVWKHARPVGSGDMPDQQDYEDIEKICRHFVDIQGRIERGERPEEAPPF